MSAHVDLFGDLLSRVGMMKMLLETENLTPLLRQEMNYVVKLYAAAIEDPDIDDLDHRELVATNFESLMAHWNATYGNMAYRATLLTDMKYYQMILISKFLDDYTHHDSESTTMKKDKVGWIIERACIVDEHYAVTENEGHYAVPGNEGGGERRDAYDVYTWHVQQP